MRTKDEPRTWPLADRFSHRLIRLTQTEDIMMMRVLAAPVIKAKGMEPR